ncbi:MAG: hypothetical protein JWO19_1637 [Bryobacterales bacterium]|nr:hypothetical protein [Bryobacterales bacterium]
MQCDCTASEILFSSLVSAIYKNPGGGSDAERARICRDREALPTGRLLETFAFIPVLSRNPNV